MGGNCSIVLRQLCGRFKLGISEPPLVGRQNIATGGALGPAAPQAVSLTAVRGVENWVSSGLVSKSEKALMKEENPMRMLVVPIVAALAGISVPAFAFPGVSVSLGEGIQVNDGVQLSPLNVEGVVFTSFGITKLDLGLLFNIEEFDVKTADLLVVRPGVRVAIPKLFYVRGAVPITIEEEIDFGFLIGAGKNLLNLRVASLFAELDATFMHEVDFTKSFPIEARLGLEIKF